MRRMRRTLALGVAKEDNKTRFLIVPAVKKIMLKLSLALLVYAAASLTNSRSEPFFGATAMLKRLGGEETL
jgi:hypothetical protein